MSLSIFIIFDFVEPMPNIFCGMVNDVTVLHRPRLGRRLSLDHLLSSPDGRLSWSENPDGHASVFRERAFQTFLRFAYHLPYHACYFVRVMLYILYESTS